MSTYTETSPIETTADFFDSRDIIARIEELEARDAAFKSVDPDEHDPEAYLDEDEQAELKMLQDFAENAKGYVADWEYGETFINEDYFEEYAKEFASDVMGWKDDGSWPNPYIDWTAASDALKQDYTSFDMGGSTFWAR
jgi:hypothetical protein